MIHEYLKDIPFNLLRILVFDWSEGRRLQREKCVQVWPRSESSERGGTRTTRGKRPTVTESVRISVFRIFVRFYELWIDSNK